MKVKQGNKKPSSFSLLIDFYQLTMAQGYWQAGLENKEAIFHLFFRNAPFKGGFALSAGLQNVIDYLNYPPFDKSDIRYLASLKKEGKYYFCPKFLHYLSELKWSLTIEAVVEGRVVFAHEPLMRVQGPLIQCQLLESALLNLTNFSTLIATKAARICLAAKEAPVLEFGLRRAPGRDGALTASRSAYIGGGAFTSNLMAAKQLGIPVSGTHSHSWVMAFEEEITAFQAFASSSSSSPIFLVDTYQTMNGVKKAIQVGKWLKKQGKELAGIRLDSGDLVALSQSCRQLLDEAGFLQTKIVASNDLDEYEIYHLKAKGAKIDVWAVGTNLVTAKDDAALNGVYKLSALRNLGEPWRYTIKLSEQIAKTSTPGLLQVKRFYKNGQPFADCIYDEAKQLPAQLNYIDLSNGSSSVIDKVNQPSEELLTSIFKQGEQVYESPDLKKIKESAQKELALFRLEAAHLFEPFQYTIGMERSLFNEKQRMIEHTKNFQ